MIKIFKYLKGITLRNRVIHLIIISIFTILSYINTLNNGFAWDDPTFILHWQGPRYIANLSYLLEGLIPSEQGGVFRPARGLFYLISYHIWGTNPQGYHIQAIFIQLVITIIFYFIVFSLSKDKLLSFLASLLFGTHPIHTEAISFITASFDSISFIFLGLAFLLYIKLYEFKSGKERIISYIGTLLYGSIAILTYEMSLALPLLCLSYDLIYKKINRKNLPEKGFFYISFAILLIVYGAVRFFILKGSLRGNFSLLNITWGFLTIPEIYVKTLWLLIYPYVQQPYEQLHLNILFLVDKIPIITLGSIPHNLSINMTFYDWLPIFSFFVILIVSIFIFINQKKNNILKFSILWIFISMLPSTNFVPKGQFFADRYLYLASLGFCIILSILFCKILRFTSNQKFKYAYILTTILFSVTLLSYIYMTYARNQDWKNDGTLFNAAYNADPTNAMAVDSLAAVYLQRHQLGLSLSLIKHALDLNPQSPIAYDHLGVIYQQMNNINLAKKAYLQAIKMDPSQTDAYYGLGLIAIDEKEYKDAEVFFENALKYGNNSQKTQSYYKLADVYSKTDHNDLAINELKLALDISPLDINTNLALANLYLINHQPEEGVKLFSEMINLDPNNDNNYFLMGNFLTQIGDYQTAEKNFLVAISLNDTDPDYYNSLGLLYIKMNNPSEATKQFEKSIQINPTYQPAINNLKQV